MSLATPTATRHSMHGRRGRLCAPRRTPLSCARLPRRHRFLYQLSLRSATARPCAMRYEVRGGVARRDPASVRRIRLRYRFADRAEHHEGDHYAPHGNPHRCARSRVRACAVFRWSVAPLRHHHFKFLRWPRSRRASSAYPQDPRRDSADSDARQANHHHT